jgi:SET domain/MYND finger
LPEDNIKLSTAQDQTMVLKQRQRGIEKCIEWVDAMGRNNDSFTHMLPLHRISFETASGDAINSGNTSYRPPMVGVFAKQAIKQGDIVLTVPQDCVLSESHPLLDDLASKVVDKAMALYGENLAACTEKNPVNPWDFFSKSKGRVFCEDELRLALHITLLIFVHRGDQSGNSALHKAAAHWAYYFDSLPDDYDSLIFYWKEEELENMKGTSCYALAQRLRKEARNNWEDSFSDVVTDYLKKEGMDEVDNDMLYKCYIDAICTIYSRMYALEMVSGAATSRNNTRCTFPLVDLINGDREDSNRCNVHLLHFPGTHGAVQANRNIAAGEELLTSYGVVSNQIYISKFGFLPLNKQGNPTIDLLDAVHVLPPPNFVWEASDPRWTSLTSSSDGKALERIHLLSSDTVSAQTGTPFALTGDKGDQSKVRTSETFRPPYFENFHLFAMMSLTDAELDPEEQIIEPWEPGSIIMEMIDYRLEDLPTASFQEDQDLLSKQEGNMKTGTLYRMLERELLQLWRHATAKQFEVYGETNSKKVKFEPLAGKGGCAVCQAVLAGPLKSCTQCKAVSYCSRNCQKEDWKGGHREYCRPVSS